MKNRISIVLIMVIIFSITSAVSWRCDLNISSGSRTETLIYGVDPDGEILLDDLDVPLPFTPPTGLYTYFKLDDPANPFITMLSTDIRSDQRYHMFRIFIGGVTGDAMISWDESLLPAGSMRIALANETNRITPWENMYETDHLDFSAPSWIWINFKADVWGVDNPPYISFAYPEPDREDVLPTSPILINVTDRETGINPRSVRLFVDGSEVTSVAEMERIDHSLKIYYEHPPFGLGNLIAIRVIAEDISTVPNILDESYMFQIISSGAIPNWVFPLWVTNINAIDTIIKELFLGTAWGASELYDTFDIAIPSIPFPRFMAFFNLDDPAYPFLTRLSRDIRVPDNDNYWLLNYINPGDEVTISWAGDLIPETCRMKIGTAFPGTMPDTWENMKYFSFLNIPDGERPVIYYHVIDTIPPRFIYSLPEDSSTGINIWSNLLIVIVDYKMGIDASSVKLEVEGVDVTPQIETFYSAETLFVLYSPDVSYLRSTTINWHLEVSDLETPPNNLDYNAQFTTGNYPSPNWLVRLFVRHTADASFYSMAAFGADEAGSPFIDPGLDFIAPPFVGGISIFNLRIPDPTGGWIYLLQDIRDLDSDSVIWELECSSVREPFFITWDISELPDSDEIFWGYEDASGGLPTEWYNMADSNIIPINDTEVVYFRLIKPEPPSYCVRGNIYLEDASDFSGSIVRIVDPLLSDTTEMDGSFEICEVPNGANITIVIEHENYQKITHHVIVVGDIVLTDTLRLKRYRIFGRIRLQGLPPGNWYGSVLWLDSLVSLTTDSSGFFRFTDVKYGMHALYVSHDGYIGQDTTFMVSSNRFFNIVLEPEIVYGDLFIHVTLESGDPAAGAAVVMDGLGPHIVDRLGWTSFINIPYDNYDVKITYPGYNDFEVGFILDLPVETLEVVLSRKHGVIYGIAQLLHHTGSFENIKVKLDDFDSVVTNRVGFFKFDDVVFGTHDLRFEYPEYYPLDTTVLLWEPGTLEVNVQLSPEIVFNAPRDLVVYSGHHDRISLRWLPPEYTPANLVGYGIIRAEYFPSGGDTIAKVPVWTTGFIDEEVRTGLIVYHYRVFAIYEEGTSEPTPFVMGFCGDDPVDPDILIVDFDNYAQLADDNKISEDQAIKELIDLTNVKYEVTFQDEQLDTYELLDYKAVMVITGVNDSINTKLSFMSLAKIADFLGSNGNVFWEGADIAEDYSSILPIEIMSLFGISRAHNGRPRFYGNVETLTPETDFWPLRTVFEYYYKTFADHRIDELNSLRGAVPILRSQDSPAPMVSNIRMVAKEGSFEGFDSNWRTVASSIYLGGIKYINNVSNRWEIFRAIWMFFTGEDIGTPEVQEYNIKPVLSKVTIKVNPCPFNSSLNISVSVNTKISGDIFIQDISGRVIEKISGGKFTNGLYLFQWNADGWESGIYFITFAGEDYVTGVRAVLIR